ncbi:MAG TPA: DNA primase [Dehalococcoidia bacterium]|nr:DNA primase [Dehalococcoidia bacterium]
MTVLDEVKQRVDIVDLISGSGRTQLQKSGRTYKGRCPFHQEKTPSFVVYPEDGRYKCFGCGKHGDAITFVMDTQNVDFKEALAELAQRAGIPLAAVRRDADPEVEHGRQRLRDALEAANRYFHNLLLASPSADRARHYAESRALDRPTIEAFQIGYSPAGWTDLSEYLKEQGFADQDILDAGLLIERDDGRRYDRFRDRLMFPIRDAEGRLVGFGARALDPESQPKYLNSPQTILFDKGAILYGIDRARQPIRQAAQAVVVEGYMDVIALHQRGIQNVVAAMGTSLTDRQIRTLKRFSNNIVLALDADAAGAEATLRGLDVARSALDHKVVPVPTWRGTVRFEQALNAQIRVAVLSPGQDPDDVAKQGVDRWRELIAQARPVLDYLLEVVAAQVDRADPKAKSAAANRILPIIGEVKDPVAQADYVQRLARLLDLNERNLLAKARELGSATPAEGTVAPPEPDQSINPTLSPDFHCLVLLLNDPSLAAIATEMDLTAQDFADPVARSLFASWQATGGELDPETLDRSLEPVYQKLLGYGLPADGVASRQIAFRDVVAKLQRIRWETWQRTDGAVFPSELTPDALAGQSAQAERHKQLLRALKDRHRTSRPS